MLEIYVLKRIGEVNEEKKIEYRIGGNRFSGNLNYIVSK